MNEISDIINDQVFSDSKTRILFSVFSDVLKKQKSLDIASVISRCSELKIQDMFLNEKFDEIDCSLESARELAKKLKRLSIVRDGLSLLKKTHEQLGKFTGAEPLAEIISTVESPLFNFSNSIYNQENTTELVFDDIEKYVTFLEDNPADNVGLSTGLPSLDQAIGGGLRRKAICVAAARTGEGKSILNGCIARFNAAQGIKCLILDSEMSCEDNKVRSLAAISKVDLGMIEKGSFSKFPELKNRVRKAAKELSTYPISYVSIAGKELDEILSIARRWVNNVVGKTNGKTNECLILLDYLKMNTSKTMAGLQENQILGFFMNSLHSFAVENDVPIYTSVQVNRQGINTEDLSVLSMSDRISWLSSNCFLIKNKTEEEIMNQPEAGNMKLIVMKTRSGPGLAPGDYICLNKIGRYSILQEIDLKSNLDKK